MAYLPIYGEITDIDIRLYLTKVFDYFTYPNNQIDSLFCKHKR